MVVASLAKELVTELVSRRVRHSMLIRHLMVDLIVADGNRVGLPLGGPYPFMISKRWLSIYDIELGADIL